MYSSNCCFLTCIQILKEAARWSNISISLRIFHVLSWSAQLKEATVKTGHGTTDWFQIGKGVYQGCIYFYILYILYIYCHPAYLTYMQSTSWETLGWKKHKLESRLPGEISITSDMQMIPPLWQKLKRNSKASWWKWKRRVKKLAQSSTFRKLRSWHLDPSPHGK